MQDTSNKKQLIADTYLQMLKKKPGDKISVKMVIEECGLSRQTFYYHFKDIIDVAEYTLQQILADTLRKCQSMESSKDMLRELLTMVENNRQLIKKLEGTSECKNFEKYVAHGIADTMEEILEKKNDPVLNIKRTDLKFMLEYFSYGLLGYVLERIGTNEKLDIESLTDQLFRLYSGKLELLGRDKSEAPLL